MMPNKRVEPDSYFDASYHFRPLLTRSVSATG